MKKKFRLNLLSLLVIILLTCSPVAIVADNDLSLVGTITLDATIETDDGDSYLIGENENSAALESLAGKRVELTGKLTEVKGELFFFVNGYSVVEGAQ